MIRHFTSSYSEKNQRRQTEITECLKRNLSCNSIDEIYLFLEMQESPPLKHEKIKTRQSDIRPRYNDFFQWAEERRTSPLDLSVISNSDIYFDESLGVLAQALKSGQCAALSRWNVSTPGNAVLFDRNDSQDVWIFRGPLRKIEGDFCVGIPRCDNRMLYELRRAGYEVINPAFSIRTYHLHAGHREEYQNEKLDHIVEPPYAYLWPHNLWSLPRTLVHNVRYPDARISWRLDRRKLLRTLPARVIRKAITTFRAPTIERS